MFSRRMVQTLRDLATHTARHIATYIPLRIECESSSCLRNTDA